MKANEFPGWETSGRIRVVESGGISKVIVNAQNYMQWDSGDEAARRMAIVQLYACGLGRQADLARAFGVHVNSVQRYIADFTGHGMQGLISRPAGPKARWKITARVRAKILVTVLIEKVDGLEAIQKRLKEGWHEEVSLPSISQVLVENGLCEEQPSGNTYDEVTPGELFSNEHGGQLSLVFDGERQIQVRSVGNEAIKDDDFAHADQTSENHLTGDARMMRDYSQRQRVYLDRLEQGDYNAYAGGFLFAPLLSRGFYLSALRDVVNIRTYNGYSLEELCLTLFYFDIFGFQSLEDFKRVYAEEFGLLIGRTKSPSHFSLRRFLHAVRQLGKSEELIDKFALGYLSHGAATWGVMYIDGHFLPYYGVELISKGWHGVRKIPQKGSYNFLAVDERFKPWLFLIRSSTEDLLQKIPELIDKAKKIGLQAGLSRERVDNLIVLFDREGYSAELYRYLDGKDKGDGPRRAIFISWAKYVDKWLAQLSEEQFDKTASVNYEIKKPAEVKYFETKRTMNKYGEIRAVVIQSGGEKQRAVIYTNGTSAEIDAERIVQLMCRRWGEENLIKELMQKHRINYTPGYVTEDLDEQPMMDNPQVKELKQKRDALVRELHKYKIELADRMLAKERKGQRCEGEILENIVRLDNGIFSTQSAIDALPVTVRFDKAHDGEKLMKLNYEKKRFLDCIKVFVYNTKEQMCRMLLKHYGNQKKEILSALSMIIDRGGYVKLENGELRVQLRRFQNREIDYAARHLCEELNQMNPTTLDNYRLPIRYEVQ